MAYVVARPRGRFEIRESVHTARGPRARSLANFAALTDEVLNTARRRATRPFDPVAVRASARRAGSPVRRGRRARAARSAATSTPAPAQTVPTRAPAPGRVPAITPAAAHRFVAGTRRMARSLEPRPPAGEEPRREPGETLIDLLNFAEQITPFVPARQDVHRLGFPPLARLVRATPERERRPGQEDPGHEKPTQPVVAKARRRRAGSR
jgi:hypothetical protein